MSNYEYETLIASLLDGELNENEHEKINHLMKSDPEFRKLYLNHCQMVANLKWEEGSLNAEPASEIQPTIQIDRISSRSNIIPIFKAIAALLIIGVGCFLLLPKQDNIPQRGIEVAKLTGASGVELEYGIDGSPVQKGQTFLSGDYYLISGLIELSFPNGSQLVIEAPSRFKLKDDQELILTHGSITAHIPSKVENFRVVTPNAYIDDVGTDYGITVHQESTGEVHVFKGKIVLHTNSEEETPYTLKAGEASLVNTRDISPSSIDINNERYIRRLEEPNYSYSELILKNKPILYFPMQPSVDGITLVDESGHLDHGEIHGVRGKPLWTVGRIGTCIRFEGPTKRGFAIVHDYPKTTNNTLSGAAWVYAKSRPKWASIMKNWSGGPAHGQFHFGLLENEGCLEVHIHDSDGKEVFALDSKPLPLHQWHHVAFVADGNFLKLYRNGKEVAATPYTSIHTNPKLKALAIGTKLNLAQQNAENNYSNDWHGRLDELSLFNHALTPNTIEKLHLAGLANMELN